MHIELKTRLIFIVLLTSCLGLNAQTNLGMNYNSTGSGVNLSLSASRVYNSKHEVGVGLRFNINRIKHPDNQNNIFRKRLFATRPLHYFGVESFYEKRVFSHWEGIQPFLFYLVQFTYSTTRNQTYSPYGITFDHVQLYSSSTVNFGPFYWLDQSIGVGFKAKINSNWYIKQRLGFGTTFIMGTSDNLNGFTDGGFSWEFGEGHSVGIGYTFNASKQ